MKSMQYDSLIMGSSPLMLLEAIYQTIANKKVIVVDKSDVLGGAWYLLDFFEHKDVESGCHIWYRDRVVHQFFKESLGLDLQEYSPQPQVIVDKKRYFYKFKTIKNLKSSIMKFEKPSKIYRDFRSVIEESSIVSKYYYPRRGSVELMQKLFFILEKLNIEVRKNTEVKKIKLNEEEAIVTLDNNEQINCKEVVAASHSELGEVHYQDKVEIIKNNRENSNFNIHILIEGISNRAFSYIHVFGNEYLIRLGDLSFQLNKGSNNMLICVQITSQLFKKFGESEKTVQVALDELKNQQLIPSDAKLLKFKFSNYTCQYRNFEETSFVEKKLGPLVRFVNTINLTYSIRRELDRWTELDKNNVIKSFN